MLGPDLVENLASRAALPSFGLLDRFVDRSAGVGQVLFFLDQPVDCVLDECFSVRVFAILDTG